MGPRFVPADESRSSSMDKTVALEATNVAICRIVHSGPTAF